MNKMLKRCNEEGVICRGLRRSTLELELELRKMRELHKKAQEYAYGYMAAFAGIDVEECAFELRDKLE